MPFNHFDHVAGIYSRAAFTLTEKITQLLDLSPDANLLDIGGGTGRVAAALRGISGPAVVADPSRKMLQYARHKELPTVCTPAETLPFPSNSFDRIIMVDAFHHVYNQDLTARELWRVLKPGGKMLIIEPDIQKSIVKLIAVMERILLMRSRILSAGNIQALFKEKMAHTTYSKEYPNILVLVEKVR